MGEEDEHWKNQFYERISSQMMSMSSLVSVVRTQLSLQSKIKHMKNYHRSMENQLHELKSNQTGSSSPSPSADRDLMVKMQQLQEELTNSYKRNSEDATAMLALTNQVQKLQKSIMEKDTQVDELKLEIE